jgi:hypothetical protein
MSLLWGCAASTPPALPAPAAVDPGWTDTGVWEFLGHQGRRISTEHFEIRTTITDPRIIDALPDLLEASFRDVQMLAPDVKAPGSPFICYLLADERQWRNAVRIVVPGMADRLHNLGRGGFTIRSVSVLYDIDPPGRCRDTLALAAHEAWHQVTQRVFKDQLPEWLEEGLATRMEGLEITATGVRPDASNNPERQRRLRWMLYTNRIKTLREFFADDPYAALERDREDLLDYYAQAWGNCLPMPCTAACGPKCVPPRANCLWMNGFCTLGSIRTSMRSICDFRTGLASASLAAADSGPRLLYSDRLWYGHV